MTFSTGKPEHAIVIMQKQKRNITTRLRDIIVILFLFLGGAYFVYIAAHGYLTSQASTIGKDSPWLSRSEYPAFFWISILFHATAGLYALMNGAKMLARVFNLKSRKR